MSEGELPDPRALDLCAIGLGQGGGNLAAEWHRRGHRALVLNTARSDVEALSHHEGLALEDHEKLFIGLGNTGGAGKDPDYGAACVEEHADAIRKAVEDTLGSADGVLLCAGLGGGTGSAAATLVDVLEPLDLPLISVVTLPSDAESGITKVNAVRTANALVSRKLGGSIFIDNERLVESFPDIDLISYYPAVNARVLEPLDALNRLNGDPNLWSVRSFDGEDLRKVLLSGGILQTHAEKLPGDGPISADQLVGVVSACVDGGRHLATGLRLEQCAYLALVVTGPESLLGQTPIQVLDDAIGGLKERTGGGAVYEGLYAGPDSTPVTAYVLSASLALPRRVEDLLGAAREEAGALMEKIAEEVPSLEISSLEGLSLFRAPARRDHPGARPPSPTPRPLGAQMFDVEDLDSVAPAEVTGIGGQAASSPTDGRPTLPSEATEHLAKAGGGQRVPPQEDLVPRVGTGQHEADDGAQMEPTKQVRKKKGSRSQEGKASRSSEGKPARPRKKTGRKKTGSKSGSAEGPVVRVGTGKKAADGRDQEVTESVPLSEVESAMSMESIEDLPFDEMDIEKDLQQEAGFEDSLDEALEAEGLDQAALEEAARQFDESAGSTRPVDDDAVVEEVPEEFELDDLDETYATDKNPLNPLTAPASDQGQPTVVSDVDQLLLSSIMAGDVRGGGTGLQNVYEDLIDRFRQAPDKRGRERVARRLIEDSHADDVEVRALAVWAMVKLEEATFRRALGEAAEDKNSEIAKLAQTGLDRI